MISKSLDYGAFVQALMKTWGEIYAIYDTKGTRGLRMSGQDMGFMSQGFKGFTTSEPALLFATEHLKFRKAENEADCLSKHPIYMCVTS